MQNFLPLRREIREHWIYKDNDCFKVWVDMLFSARFSKEPKTDTYKGTIYTINYSEFLYSRPSYSIRLNISESKLRTLMNNLIKDNMIEKVIPIGKNKATIFKIVNFKKYNISPSECVDTQGIEANIRQLMTKSSPTDDQLTTKSQPLKKNVKNDKEVYIEFFENVWSLYPNKKGKNKVAKAQIKKLQIIGIEELTRCVNRYKQTKEEWKAWQQGSTFFNGGYVDYLDINFEDKPKEQTWGWS